MDQTGFTGVINSDALLPVVTKMVGGRVAALDSAGVLTLADGNEANGAVPLGFIINDAAGYFFENKPAFASGMISLTYGPGVVITDQINTTLTFAIGDILYVDSASNTTGNAAGWAGVLTNVAPSGGGTLARPVGIATSTASVAAPQLTVVLF
jgi:hypothetical protein